MLMSRAVRIQRGLEFTVLFVLLPLTLVAVPGRVPIIVPLLGGALLSLLLLLPDRSFQKRQLWQGEDWRPVMPGVLKRFAVLAPAILLLTWLVDRSAMTGLEQSVLFRLPSEKPLLWLMILLFYPLVSVYPQGLIYRALFFHRYGRLFGGPTVQILVAAVVFALAHAIISWVAVAVTFVGGLMFAHTYLQSRSLLASGIEHALYGCWAFTCGLGWFLYSGGAGAQ